MVSYRAAVLRVNALLLGGLDVQGAAKAGVVPEKGRAEDRIEHDLVAAQPGNHRSECVVELGQPGEYCVSRDG